jgi:hypothetical protein
VARDGPQIVDQRQPLLGCEMLDARVEAVTLERAREAEAIEAAAASVGEEPPRARERDRPALGTEHRSVLVHAIGGAVLDDQRYRPALLRRRRVRVGEVPRLRQVELEPAVGLARAYVHQRMARFLDPGIRDRGHVLAR